ncbi:MAG: paraquat-inducible protein A [Gammaproteobacteria bacterium SHHR-1]|uniref:paraquat-inducible protein A n=1 Tax=Magnetovirga frankeli TaxID=947516 RepID=UPI001293DB6A|nr:paraquat-inducible protein A [gamma proteobacterium SS-5]
MTRALDQGLVACAICATLDAQGRAHCQRCGAPLHPRKPDSLARSWAYLLAALVLYLPANLLPVMTVISLGRGEPSTILSGVVLLWHEGMWPLALLIFVASVFVPVLKLIILAYLLLSVQRASLARPRDRTRLFRLTEFVGRWSMVDIFVVGILVALVQLGEVARIEAGMGASFFAAVVVLTMLAAEAFDPRLIWDRLAPN